MDCPKLTKQQNIKCGTYVTHNSLKYMFMGYVNKKECCLADSHGNTHNCFLNEIKTK